MAIGTAKCLTATGFDFEITCSYKKWVSATKNVQHWIAGPLGMALDEKLETLSMELQRALQERDEALQQAAHAKIQLAETAF